MKPSSRIQFASGLGQRLRDERKRLGFTQEQLADQLGVARRTVFNHETDFHPVTVEVLNKLDELGADCFYILFGRRFLEFSVPLDAALLERVLDQEKILCRDQNGKKLSLGHCAELIVIAYAVLAAKESKL